MSGCFCTALSITTFGLQHDETKSTNQHRYRLSVKQPQRGATFLGTNWLEGHRAINISGRCPFGTLEQMGMMKRSALNGFVGVLVED
jgi:hypothetical protein